MEAYYQLIRDLAIEDANFYLTKGDLTIKLKVLKAIPICNSDELEDDIYVYKATRDIGISLILEGENRVDIFIDDIVAKLKGALDFIFEYEFCYKICSVDNDRSFYIGKPA